ncbi:MAG: ABC transporter permease [Desulfovibrio sp.]|nr:ABC transporter permease [Desulfovibrio sp.]
MGHFTYLWQLACKSAWNRRGTLLLIVLSIALSTTLLLGIEKLRAQVRDNFVQAVSGLDLVIGARGSSLQLVLYAVFHLGSATNNMGYDTAKALAQKPQVAFTIPISLGDTHRDFPVVATNAVFYEKFRYRHGLALRMAEGHAPEALFDVVLGAEVARSLGYQLGSKIVLSHGQSGNAQAEHSANPFTVSGLLAPTGTPVDRSLYISLEAMEAIHLNWQNGLHQDQPLVAENLTKLEPRAITALLVGLKKRSQVFALQREINEGPGEPLTAVLPGVAMNQIWEMVSVGEQALLVISALVTVVGLAGLAAAILAGLGERRRELAVLRSAGASPVDILWLMAMEGLLLVLSGTGLGLVVIYALLALCAPFLAEHYGVFLALTAPSSGEWLLLLAICLSGFCASLLPACKAYRMSLSDGLTVSV